MNIIQLQILLIAVFVSLALALPGNFLVLRGVAMMSDAISHSVLFGIAVMFLLVQNLHSPLLLLGAALAGLVTVAVTEKIIQSKCLKQDAAIGVVFPFFFSCGVMLITLFARDVHIDLDMVVLGEIALAPFNRFVVQGFDCGPVALWSMGCMVVFNSLFIYLFFKELVVAIFDEKFAYGIGFSPQLVYYMLMLITSITAVCAFDVVGSIVVVALMIAPPATAYIFTRHIRIMIILSLIISIGTSLMGYMVAYSCDISIAGSIATMSGIVFVLALTFAPNRVVMNHAHESLH